MDGSDVSVGMNRKKRRRRGWVVKHLWSVWIEGEGGGVE